MTKRSSRDALLAAERARVPFRGIEQRARPCRRRRPALSPAAACRSSTITSLICRQTVTTRSTRRVRYLPRFQRSSGNETPRLTTNAPTGSRHVAASASACDDALVHVDDVRPLLANQPAQAADGVEVELMAEGEAVEARRRARPRFASSIGSGLLTTVTSWPRSRRPVAA